MGVSARLRINGSFSAAERKKSSSAVCGPLRRRVPTTHTRRTGSHSNSELNLDISHTRTSNIPARTGCQIPHHIIQARVDLLNGSLGP